MYITFIDKDISLWTTTQPATLYGPELFSLYGQGSTFVDPNTTGYILSTIQVQPLLTRIYLCGPRHNLLYCIDQNCSAFIDKDQLLLTPTQLTTLF